MQSRWRLRIVWERHSVPDQPDPALEVTLRHPDPDVPERVWRTLSISPAPTSIRLTARITRHAAELRTHPRDDRPAAKTWRRPRPSRRLLLQGRRIRHHRHLPISPRLGDRGVRRTCPQGGRAYAPRRRARAFAAPGACFKPIRVADEVAGLAHVAQLGGHLASTRFREIVGAEYRVPSGGARIYWPGFGQPTDDLRHRFWTARWLSDSPQPLHRSLFELLARISVHAVPLDPSVRRLRDAALQRHYEDLRESGRSADELVEYLEDENKSLLRRTRGSRRR